MSYPKNVFFLLSILAMADSSVDNFQFYTVKHKLYPFLPAYSGMPDDNLINVEERALSSNTDDQLEPTKWAWIVIVLKSKYDIYKMSSTYEPICLGILITRSDVLSTYSCINEAIISTADGASDPVKQQNLMVKPKTVIVEWDPMMKPVTHVHYHESCIECKGSTSYIDLALLTVEIFDIVFGVIETVPHHYVDHKMPKTKLYKDCYIAIMATAPYELKSKRLSPVPMSIRNFTVRDFPSPTNYLNTTIIVGQTKLVLPNLEPRFAGSPLLCSDNFRREVLLGIYLGLACPKPKVKVSDLTNGCTKRLSKCEDCFPKPLHYLDMYDKDLCSGNAYEIVLRFDNLNEWIEDNTFSILEKQMVPYKKSQSFRSSPCVWCIVILFLQTKAVFN